MSQKSIPEHIDPFRYAEQSLSLAGSVSVSDLHRLRSNLSSDGDIVSVDLEFGKDEQGIYFLRGHLTTKLVLQCQRCMEPFVYEIMSDFLLGVVTTLDEANALPDYYEPALAKEGSLALRELVEDELLLNLPIIPRHDPEDCKVTLPLMDSGWEKEKGKNPFHILETLKDKQDKQK